VRRLFQQPLRNQLAALAPKNAHVEGCDDGRRCAFEKGGDRVAREPLELEQREHDSLLC
jgi:hypothetical protein